MQAIVLFFVILATVYFVIDIMFLARQNDKLKRENKELKRNLEIKNRG